MTQNKCKVAITGGIGSGKSTVSAFLRECGYKVVSCDEIYHKLLKDGKFKQKLAERFGNVFTDGMVDRKKLANIVFGNKQALDELNNITHGEIMERAFEEMSGSYIAFCEVPLLFENNLQGNFNEVIVVLRDAEDRIRSIMQRSNLTREQAVVRVNNQLDYANGMFSEYYVIHNDSDYGHLKACALKIAGKIEKKYL